MEIDEFRPGTEDNMLFCWRYCHKYRTWRRHISKNCKIWRTDILDSKEDFLRIRSGGFVLVAEERID